jgi:hypothetical protein
MVSDHNEHAAMARSIIDSNSYMTLGTADASGLPWVSPVWYAPAGYAELLWVSYPAARHSRNIAARPQIAIVIFDSHLPINTGQGVYMSAVAEELGSGELEHGIGIFSRRCQAQGAKEWTRADVWPPARHRLFRATVYEHFVLDRHDERIPVDVVSAR